MKDEKTDLSAPTESKYEIIKERHRRAHETGEAGNLKVIPRLLISWGTRLRADDGILYQATLSVPEPTVLVVGLRYEKKDESSTEDIVEFNSLYPNELAKYYKGRYERKRLEYKGTHKQQNVSLSPFTSVNTCSIYMGNKTNS